MPPVSHRWTPSSLGRTTGSHRTGSTAQRLLLGHKRQQRRQARASRTPALSQAPHLPRRQPRPSGQHWQHQSLGRGPRPARRKGGKSAIPLSRAEGKATWNRSFPKGKPAESRNGPKGKTTATKDHRMKTGDASQSGLSGSTPNTRSSSGTPSRRRRRERLLLPQMSRWQKQRHRALPQTAPAALPVPHGLSWQPGSSATPRVSTGGPPAPGGVCGLCASCSAAPAWSCSWFTSACCQALIQISSVVNKYFYICKELWRIPAVHCYCTDSKQPTPFLQEDTPVKDADLPAVLSEPPRVPEGFQQHQRFENQWFHGCCGQDSHQSLPHP